MDIKDRVLVRTKSRNFRNIHFHPRKANKITPSYNRRPTLIQTPDMEQMKPPRRITYHNIPSQPQSSSYLPAGHKHATTANGAIVAQRNVFPYFNTHIQLYVERTGAEEGFLSGMPCEIRGSIIAGDKIVAVYVDMPENSDFSNENGGLGRLVADLTVRTIGVPPNFSGVLYEEGNAITGDRYFTNATIDWNTAPCDWSNGNPWWYTQTVCNDASFVGHLWWMVTAA